MASEIPCLDNGYAKDEAGFLRGRVDGQLSPMCRSNFRADVEAESKALLARANLASEEGLEQSFPGLLRDWWAGVGHPELKHRVTNFAAHADRRVRVAVSDRVSKQVRRQLPNT